MDVAVLLQGCTITPQHLLYSRNALFNKVLYKQGPPPSSAVLFSLAVTRRCCWCCRCRRGRRRRRRHSPRRRAAQGLNPHFYCLPILKHEKHRQALLKAATSGVTSPPPPPPPPQLPQPLCQPLCQPPQPLCCCDAAAGNPKFFAGTDSAPHMESTKLTCCGCAGCFTAAFAPELYATAFDR